MAMQQAQLEKYRQTLLEMRNRVNGEMGSVVEAIQEDANTVASVSSLPVHPADIAMESIDADLHVLETEQGILDNIQDALQRIDDGSFGVCQSCGKSIAEDRLRALPYTPVCIECARAEEE